jgi:hypothetical protein
MLGPMRAILSVLAILAAACSSSSSAPLGTTPDAGGGGEDAPTAGDTWASYAQGFFSTYCTSCHASGSTLEPSMPASLYFTSQANVESQKDVIRCGVCVTQDPSWSCSASGPPAKQFPIGSGPKPSDAERNRIVAWITAGAP